MVKLPDPLVGASNKVGDQISQNMKNAPLQIFDNFQQPPLKQSSSSGGTGSPGAKVPELPQFQTKKVADPRNPIEKCLNDVIDINLDIHSFCR